MFKKESKWPLIQRGYKKEEEQNDQKARKAYFIYLFIPEQLSNLAVVKTISIITLVIENTRKGLL